MVTDSDKIRETSQKLLGEAKKMNLLTRTHFNELQILYERLGKLASDFHGKDTDLNTVIEDYRARYVEPCRRHATSLVTEAEALSSMFGRDRGMYVRY